jgi:cyclopropane-fatty-acyl-phospholipid synthase
MTATARKAEVVRRPGSAPRTGLEPLARLVVFWALDQLRGGELVLRLPEGTIRGFGDPAAGPSLAATIRREDFFRRIATRGQIGLGDAYVAGDWDADDLPALFELLVRNAEWASRRMPFAALDRLRELRPHLPRSNDPRRSRRHIAYHYDLGNELFQLFLDPSLAYSCAYFEHDGQSLEDAQQAKMRRLCEKLAIGPDDHVLEIGCGWGGFAIHAARERGARVTAVTISRGQYDLARSRVAEAGLGHRIEILFRDYRLVRGSFSKIVSIEMFEAIGERQFGTFFSTCDGLLAPCGVVGLQTIAVPDQRFARYRRSRDWIQETIFPGSLIPSLGAIVLAATRSSSLVVQGLEDIGINYADTLSAWRSRFFERLDDVRALGYDERFVRTWDYYLATCEALFRTRALRDLQLVLTRPFNDALPRYPSLRTTY